MPPRFRRGIGRFAPCRGFCCTGGGTDPDSDCRDCLDGTVSPLSEFQITVPAGLLTDGDVFSGGCGNCDEGFTGTFLLSPFTIGELGGFLCTWLYEYTVSPCGFGGTTNWVLEMDYPNSRWQLSLVLTGSITWIWYASYTPLIDCSAVNTELAFSVADSDAGWDGSDPFRICTIDDTATITLESV